MALIDDIISRLLRPVFDALNRWLRPLRKLWEKIIAAKDHLLRLGDDTRHLFDSIKDEVDGWKSFRSNPKIKGRVVSLPTAFEKIAALIRGIPEAYHAIVDLVRQLREKVSGSGDPKVEAEEFAADIESGEGIAGLLRRAPRLLKGLEKLFGFLAIAVDALESIVAAVGDLQTIVDEAKRIRLEVEDLDTIFLQQKNPRKVLTTTEGAKIKIRVGSLHKLQ